MNGEVAEALAEAEEMAETTSSTSQEVGGGCGSREREAKGEISFFFFHVWMAYIPVAPDSFEATGCPRSRVLKKYTHFS